ncbi:MAG: topoisomerase II [Planctomycetaceae bacterium]|nr:topoisomerase II [Planctomycetaceae bacterium]
MSRINAAIGAIHADDAYSKQEVLRRLHISQKFWDKMLDEGLPYTVVGHTRWVTGRDLIEHFSRNAKRKQETHEPITEP